MMVKKTIFPIILFFIFSSYSSLYAQEETSQAPVVVNGDTVEYSADKKECWAKGNVEVTYKDVVLTCQNLRVNTFTYDVEAEGDVTLREPRGTIRCRKLSYNLKTKTGILWQGDFQANPYFGKAEKIQRLSPEKILAQNGYFTTCNYDHPHYLFASRRIDYLLNDRLRAESNLLRVGGIPLLYLPRYTHSLRDPAMHVQVTPGKRSEWGGYVLTAWRYVLNENATGRIYLDMRQKLGISEGLGLNYRTPNIGKGDFKYYYTQERPRGLPQDSPAEFERYLVRLRHKWDVSLRTQVISEVYKIEDTKRANLGSAHNFLKDYFYREYEKDAQPLSYVLLHHNFNYSALDVLAQPRLNSWYTQEEKLPEITFTLPDLSLSNTPLFWSHNSAFVNYNYKNAKDAAREGNINYNKYTTANRLSLPFHFAFLEVSPFVGQELSYYDKNSTYGATSDYIFLAGSDFSTRFYRIFDVHTNFAGLDINGLRHVVIPKVGYQYTASTSTPAGKLNFGDEYTSADAGLSLEVENKLQTKRQDGVIDLLYLRVATRYNLKDERKISRAPAFSDVLFDLECRPYRWLRFDADALYKHSGSRDDPDYNRFSQINYDLNFDFGKERSLGFGQRYQRKGSSEITTAFTYRLNPLWKFFAYHRYNLHRSSSVGLGMLEQEYSFVRDLHCWQMELSLNRKRDSGTTIWIIFRLKAFPEAEFKFNQSYKAPRSGSA